MSKVRRMRRPACRSSWKLWQYGVRRCPRTNMWTGDTQIWLGNQSPHPGASISLIRLFTAVSRHLWQVACRIKVSHCSSLASAPQLCSCCQVPKNKSLIFFPSFTYFLRGSCHYHLILKHRGEIHYPEVNSSNFDLKSLNPVISRFSMCL